MSSPSPRQRMIESTIELVGEHGVERTSFTQVVAHSGAPRGSIYHHFPGGKAELIEEAVRLGGGIVTTGLEAALENDDPVAAVDGVADLWRTVLRDSDYAVGCPLAAVTVEGQRTPEARQAAGEAFETWKRLHAQILQRAGVPQKRARSIAELLVASIEGAVILARADRSNEPLERVLDELHILLDHALADRN